MQYICKMVHFLKISSIKSGVWLRIPQKSFIDRNAPAHAPARARSYLAHIRAHARARIRTHAHADAHTHTHTHARAHTRTHAGARVNKQTKPEMQTISDSFRYFLSTGLNAPERGSKWAFLGGPILKRGGPILKSNPPTLKSEQKKAGYFSSPAFNNKSVVMFDNTKIQKVL